MITDHKQQFLRDVLTTGVEGGIGYWARGYDLVRDDDLSITSITLVEWESALLALDLADDHNYDRLDEAFRSGTIPAEFVHEVRAADLDGAVQKVLDGDFNVADRYKNAVRRALGEFDAGEIDSDVADIIVQAACLGEIVYG